MLTEMLTIDGAWGEGGGQILRSSLALSLCLQQPFRIINIRKARPRPGLAPQHQVAVNAAAAISHAVVRGNTQGSTELTFVPQPVSPGQYEFDIGSAGSTALVLQTVLPALLGADAASRVTLVGGTHNPWAPPYEFIHRAFLPLLVRMGVRASVELQRPGFYPAGGGKLVASVAPARRLEPLALTRRGRVRNMTATALLAHLPGHIGERELATLKHGLDLPDEALQLQRCDDARGPGNAVMVIVECEHVTEVFTGYGMKGVPAETVAAAVVTEVRAYLRADVPVGAYLADQLILPCALAGSGRFHTLAPSRHLQTNIHVIQQFMDIHVSLQQVGTTSWCVQLG